MMNLICWIRGHLYRPTYTLRKRNVRGRGTVCEFSFECVRCCRPSGWFPKKQLGEFMARHKISWSR